MKMPRAPKANELQTLADLLAGRTLDSIRCLLPDEAAKATLAALGTERRPREPREEDDSLIQALQRIAWFAVMHALMGQRDGREAAERAELVREARRHITEAVEALERVAGLRGYPPPKVWHGKRWALLADWFATEATRETPGAHAPPRHPARLWSTVRLLSLYEVATRKRASPGPKEADGPCCRFIQTWRNGVREALEKLEQEAREFAHAATIVEEAVKARRGEGDARHAVQAIAPPVRARTLWDEVAEAVATMDAADTASCPSKVARGVLTPRLEAELGWIGGGELSTGPE